MKKKHLKLVIQVIYWSNFYLEVISLNSVSPVCKHTCSCDVWLVTDNRAGATVFLSVLFERGLVGERAGGGEDMGDFDPRTQLGGGDPADSTDPTPLASSWDTNDASEDGFELEGRRPWTWCGCHSNTFFLIILGFSYVLYASEQHTHLNKHI
jgi:hypothetical protein